MVSYVLHYAEFAAKQDNGTYIKGTFVTIANNFLYRSIDRGEVDKESPAVIGIVEKLWFQLLARIGGPGKSWLAPRETGLLWFH